MTAAMGRVADVLGTIAKCRFSLAGHFTLPDEAWWDDFYAPMEQRIAALRARCAADAEALDVLDRLAQEPEMHRWHPDDYAYEFFVVRTPSRAGDRPAMLARPLHIDASCTIRHPSPFRRITSSV